MILQLLTLLGALALFVFGLEMLSTGIQKSCGDRLRRFEKWMTSGTPFKQILSGAVKAVRENELYTPMAFAGGNAARKVLDYSMSDQASADRDTVLERIAAGQSAEAAMAEFLTDDYFEAWYQATLAQLQQYEG